MQWRKEIYLFMTVLLWRSNQADFENKWAFTWSFREQWYWVTSFCRWQSSSRWVYTLTVPNNFRQEKKTKTKATLVLLRLEWLSVFTWHSIRTLTGLRRRFVISVYHSSILAVTWSLCTCFKSSLTGILCNRDCACQKGQEFNSSLLFVATTSELVLKFYLMERKKFKCCYVLVNVPIWSCADSHTVHHKKENDCQTFGHQLIDGIRI